MRSELICKKDKETGDLVFTVCVREADLQQLSPLIHSEMDAIWNAKTASEHLSVLRMIFLKIERAQLKWTFIKSGT